MITFIGMVYKEDQKSLPAEEQFILKKQREEHAILRSGRLVVAYRNERKIGRDSFEDVVYQSLKYVVFICGRILSLNGSVLKSGSLSEDSPGSLDSFIEELLARYNSNSLAINGEFVIFIYAKKTKKFYCLEDHFGQRPFYYIEKPDYLAFSSDVSFLMPVMSTNIQIDDRWVADSISTIKSEKHRTPYVNLYKLEPAYLLEYSGRITKSPYWKLKQNEEYKDFSFNDSVDCLSEKLRKSINLRLGGSLVIGAELSGGLDSSGVTSLAYSHAKECGKQFYAFTHCLADQQIGIDYPYVDEREFSKTLSSSLGLTNHLYCNGFNLGIIQSIRESIHLHSGPTQQAFDIFSDVIYTKAQSFGVDTLVSGFGGDEGISFIPWTLLTEYSRQRNREKYIAEYLNHNRNRRSPQLIAFLNYYASSYFPSLKRFVKDSVHMRIDWKKTKFSGLGYDEDFGKQLYIKEKFFTEKRKLEGDNIKLAQYGRINNSHIPQRIESSYFSANAKEVKYVYPLLDVELLEVFYSISSEYMFGPGLRRAIFREVLKGHVPEKIRLRDDKSRITIPSVHRRIRNDYFVIKDLIQRSRDNNKFHYLDYQKMQSWLDRINNTLFSDKLPDNPQAFTNSLQILILQEMERSGEFKSGIKV